MGVPMKEAKSMQVQVQENDLGEVTFTLVICAHLTLSNNLIRSYTLLKRAVSLRDINFARFFGCPANRIKFEI